MKLQSQNSASDGLAPKSITLPTVSSPALPLPLASKEGDILGP